MHLITGLLSGISLSGPSEKAKPVEKPVVSSVPSVKKEMPPLNFFPENVRFRIMSFRDPKDIPFCRAFWVNDLVSKKLQPEEISADMRLLAWADREAVESVQHTVTALRLSHIGPFSVGFNERFADPTILKDLAFRFRNCRVFTANHPLGMGYGSAWEVLKTFAKLREISVPTPPNGNFYSDSTFPRVQNVHLQRCDYETQDIEKFLESFPGLRQLSFSSSKPISVAPFVQRKNQFTALELGSLAKVSDQDLRSLIEAQKDLTSLTMHAPQAMSNDTVTYLCEQMKKLQKLRLTFRTTPEFSFGHLARSVQALPVLEELEIDPSWIQLQYNDVKFDQKLHELFRIKTLKRLQLHHFDFDKGILKERPDLEELGFTAHGSKPPLDLFQQSKLRKLTLFWCWEIQEYIQLCAPMQHLQHLVLHAQGSDYTYEAVYASLLDPLVGTKTLRTIEVIVYEPTSQDKHFKCAQRGVESFMKARPEVQVTVSKGK